MSNTEKLDGLLEEIDAALGVQNLAPERQLHYEGGRYYLRILKDMVASKRDAKKQRKPKPASSNPEPKAAERFGKTISPSSSA